MRDENDIFAEYREKKTPELEVELLKALRAHAHAVVWELLHETNMDIVNLGMFLAIRNADKFRGDAKFSTWFHQIIKNLCMNAVRRRAVRREVPLEMDVGYVPAAPAAFLLGELKKKLQVEEQRLLDYRVAGLGFEEIAGKLGISVVYARRKWLRLKRKLEEVVHVGN